MEQNIIKYQPGIYIVPTPIGNLEDITIRALRLLSAADIIACEDTRTTGQLLQHFSIKPKKLFACHEHNEKSSAQELCKKAAQGQIICYVSDAGTPMISDPGSALIQQAIEQNIHITALPGASALLPALCLSGFNLQSFSFIGFPPHKKGRQTFIQKLTDIPGTVALYESPHRILEFLHSCSQIPALQNRDFVLARELTKKFEQIIRGKPNACHQILEEQGIKGEFVIIIGPIQQLSSE
jgi:16S rRNA (cytidine1402-2'-O)-methyltransferase